MNIVVALHVCVRLSVASRLSHSYRMELFVNPRKKSHGRTSPGEKQYHNYGKASPSMVDLPPPPPYTHFLIREQIPWQIVPPEIIPYGKRSP